MLTEDEQIEFSNLFKMLLDIRDLRKHDSFFRVHFNMHHKYIMDRINALSERENFTNQPKGEKYAK